MIYCDKNEMAAFCARKKIRSVFLVKIDRVIPAPRVEEVTQGSLGSQVLVPL